MSFAYKTIKGSDITISPYVANKQYSYPSSSLSSSNIVVYTGEYDPQYMVSGTVYNPFDPLNDTISNGYYRRLIFDSIEKLYYENYLSGSNSGMFYVSSAYDNYDQTTLASGAFDSVVKILNRFTSSGGQYNIDEYGNTTYAVLNPTKIRVISIPQDVFGNGIKPDTFSITSSTYDIRDDGQGNLFDYLSTRSFYDGTDKYQQAYYTANANGTYVGNIIYSHGFAIITNPNYLCFYPSSPIAQNDFYTILNVSESKVLPILINDYDDCKEILTSSIMTYPLTGYTFPSFSIVDDKIHITPCGANNLQVTPGTYKILYTVNNTEGVVSNFATCSLTLYNDVFTSSLISYTSGCFGSSTSQSATFSLDLGVPPYSYSLDNSLWIPISQQYGGIYNAAIYDSSSYAFGINGVTDCGLYQPTFSIDIPTADNVTVYFKDTTETILSHSMDPQLYPITTLITSQSTCLNAIPTGKIFITASGGTGSIETKWICTNCLNGGPNSSSFTATNPNHTFTSLNSGSYQVQYRDINASCIYTSPSFLISTPPPIIISYISTASTCPSGESGGPIGSIDMTVTGGSGPLDYAWYSQSVPTETFVTGALDPNHLPVGTYKLYVSDSTGCNLTSSSNITIYTTNNIVYTGAVTSSICFGGNNASISGSLSGGSGSLIPSWTGPNGFTSSNLNISGLSTGTYYLTASDSLTGCFAIFSRVVNNPSEFSSSLFSISRTLTNPSYPQTGSYKATASFLGGTPPYTAEVWISRSISSGGNQLIAGSNGIGPTISIDLVNACLTSSNYFFLSASDSNGCNMTNFNPNTTVFIQSQSVAQVAVCYTASTANPSNTCACISTTSSVFYLTSSYSTSSIDIYNGTALAASGAILYANCSLTQTASEGQYLIPIGTPTTTCDISSSGSVIYANDPCISQYFANFNYSVGDGDPVVDTTTVWYNSTGGSTSSMDTFGYIPPLVTFLRDVSVFTSSVQAFTINYDMFTPQPAWQYNFELNIFLASSPIPYITYTTSSVGPLEGLYISPNLPGGTSYNIEGFWYSSTVFSGLISFGSSPASACSSVYQEFLYWSLQPQLYPGLMFFTDPDLTIPWNNLNNWSYCVDNNLFLTIYSLTGNMLNNSVGQC